MRALLTGASGFCGRHLVEHLRSSGTEVHVAQRLPGAPCPDGVVAHAVADVTDRGAVRRLLADAAPELIFHLAGRSEPGPSDDVYRANVQYAATLLEAVDAEGLAEKTTVLLAGSAAEYGAVSPEELPIREDAPPRPQGHYGVSKLCQTMLGRVWAGRGARVVTARLFNIVGPGMPEHLATGRFAAQIARAAAGSGPAVVEVGNLDSGRDLVDVRDAVRIMASLARTPAARGAVVNVCRGSAHRTGEVLERLVRLSGIAVEIRPSALRTKRDDVPLVYGSTELRERILGPEAVRDLGRTLEDVYAAALEQARKAS